MPAKLQAAPWRARGSFGRWRSRDGTSAVGDTIEWDNKDIVAHTATARDGAWDVLIAPNAMNSTVLKTAGTVQYYCRFHPNMVGEITVKARQ